MALFSSVPVVEVHNENFREMWPTLNLALKTSTFVAIDAELSGLGNRKLLNAKSVDTRYTEMCQVAKSRSIISLGLSCFKFQPAAADDSKVAGKSLTFQVQTFNITLLCSENYVVEPLSLKFLVDHGFDFNKQYASGIPYYRGQDQENDKKYQTVRQLFTELIISEVPVVLHNALVDLVFLYQNFYTDTPSTIQKFTADLSEMFAGGIFDTKYISEFKSRTPASYLEYIFRKSQRDNRDNAANGRKHVRLSFLSYHGSMPEVILLPCGLDDQPQESEEGKSTACFQFAFHGWCPKGSACSQSHDIDCILNTESLKKKRKNKKKKNKTADKSDTGSGNPGVTDERHAETSEAQAMETSFDNTADLKTDQMETIDAMNESEMNIVNPSDNLLINETTTGNETQTGNEAQTGSAAQQINRRTGGHRAGYDSFMTGFAFACNIVNLGTLPKEPLTMDVTLAELGVQDLINKVALGGKDFPLLIQKGNFAKTSILHNQKIQKIRQVSTV